MEIRIRDINSELHKELKMLCVKQETTIQAKLIELIKKAVDKESMRRMLRGEEGE
jgi:hypothetical protein